MKLNIPTAQEAADQANAVVSKRAAAYATAAEQLIAAAIARGHRSAALPDGMHPTVEAALTAAGYTVKYRRSGHNEYEYEVTW